MDHHHERRSRSRGRPFLAGGAPLQQECWVACPYCGEAFALVVDGSAGDQTYYEDCEICCRPILFQVAIDGDGNVAHITTRREDD